MIPPQGEAWVAANVEVPLIAFLGPGGTGLGLGAGGGLGLGSGIGSGIGFQVLLAVRVFYRALITPIEHSHPIYLAKCQKLTQLLTADTPRACLEVSQGWMATSTQVSISPHCHTHTHYHSHTITCSTSTSYHVHYEHILSLILTTYPPY